MLQKLSACLKPRLTEKFSTSTYEDGSSLQQKLKNLFSLDFTNSYTHLDNLNEKLFCANTLKHVFK